MQTYEVNEIFEEIYDFSLTPMTYTIIAVAPKKDYDGDQSYFVEVNDGTGVIWYDVKTDEYLNSYTNQLPRD